MIGTRLLPSAGAGAFDPFAIPDEAVGVTVDETTTISSGGTLDWHGRASVIRRADGVLVLFYRRGTKHEVNDGGLYVRFSDDNGATWTAENETLDAVAVSGFPMNPSTLTAGQDAGEPWAIIAPSGDILLFMWRVDYNVSNGGTYMSRSSDGGETWSSAAGPIQFAGLTEAQNGNTFATDDGFVLDGTIYMGARVYTDPDQDPSAIVFCSSDDDGETWTRVSTIVSTVDYGGHGQQEIGLEYLGGTTIIGLIRDTAEVTHTYQTTSTDMGATWAAETDVTAEFDVSARHRIYTRAHLKGRDNWWQDPVLVVSGFVHPTPGSPQPRRNAVWISRDSGSTWDGPFYSDAETEDAGYGDIFYDADNDQYVHISYQGSLAAASVKQYRLTIAGI